MKTRSHKAFTLVELLVAMSISAIILGAVATLAYAMSSANDASNDTRLKQARLRSASMRLADLFHNCKLVVGNYTNTLAVWKQDLNNDGKINSNEIIFLKTNDAKTMLQWKDYELNPTYPDWTTTIAYIQSTNAEKSLDSDNLFGLQSSTIIPECSNLIFSVDKTTPRTRTVTISFDINMDGAEHHCLRFTILGPAYHLLSLPTAPLPNAIVSDDD